MIDMDWVDPAVPRLNDTDLSQAVATALPSGKVILGHVRRLARYTTWLYAEVDGSALAAVSAPKSANCGVSLAPSEGSHALYFGAGAGETGKALVAGLDGRPPRLVYDKLPNVNLYSAASGFVALHVGKIELRSWNDGSLLKLLSDGAAGQLRHVVTAQDVIAFADTGGSGGSSYLSGLSIPTSVFASSDDAGASGAADLGGDGNDWVWNEGTGGQVSGTQQWADVSLVTSAFTRDPAVARANKRTVWSGTGNGSTVLMGAEPYVVGCGYATRRAVALRDGVNRSGYLISRLRDGQAQFLAGGSSVGPLPFTFLRVLALTCTEAFVLTNLQYKDGVRATVARIKLSAVPSVTLPLAPIKL